MDQKLQENHKGQFKSSFGFFDGRRRFGSGIGKLMGISL